MTVDLDKLEALARAATPGKRTINRDGEYWPGHIAKMLADDSPIIAAHAHDEASIIIAPTDADFIAACDPANLLALIAEIRKLRNVVALTNGVSDAILAQFVDQEILRAENDELKRLLDAGCQHPRGHGD